MLRVLGIAALVALAGCCGRAERPRTRQDIFQERQQLDSLYLTASGERIIAPASPTGAVLAGEGKKDLAWLAWQCDNPACPGRAADGAAFLFTRPHPLVKLNADGTIGIGQTQSPEDLEKLEAFAEPQCPKCLALRKLADETPAQREQYAAWCQPHILPGTAKRLAELEAEYRELTQREVQRKQNGAKP